MIWVFRVSIFYIFTTFITIFFAVSGLLFLLTPFKIKYWYITKWSHIVILLAKIFCGLKYVVEGKENLPQAPFLAIANHQSMWETIFMQILLPQQSWILKKELLNIPFFGWGLRMLDPIAIDRKKISEIKYILTAAHDKFAKGLCILIYPEGTRCAPNQLGVFKRTAAAIAIFNKIPIIPIAHNAGIFWPKGFWIKQPGTITVVINKPIMPLIDDNPTTLTNNIKDCIERSIQSIQ